MTRKMFFRSLIGGGVASAGIATAESAKNANPAPNRIQLGASEGTLKVHSLDPKSFHIIEYDPRFVNRDSLQRAPWPKDLQGIFVSSFMRPRS